MAARRKKSDTFKHYDLVIYAARGSNSARTLATSLGCRRWRDDLPERYTRRKAYFRGRPYPLVLNWGSTVRPDWGNIHGSMDACNRAGFWLNQQEAVGSAINKLSCFTKLTELEVPTVKWTTEKSRVEKWLAKGYTVFARETVTGAGGEGIRLIQSGTAPNAIPTVPLYTRNFPKTHEFRVHVFDGQVIDFAEKKSRLADGDPIANRLVRNSRNGWVFAHGNLSASTETQAELGRLAIRTLGALGLVSGCVDVLSVLDTDTSRTLKNAVVCEVNTGPGLENTQTIEAYKQAILKKYNSLGRN
jgi:hypothetical protein